MLAGWIVLAAFSLSPAIARFSINGHTYPLWFYTAAFGFFILCGYGKTASVCFGIMLAARQTSIIYLPLVLTFFWRQGGWKSVFVHLGLMAVSCGLLCLPFALIDIKAFILDPLSEYKKMAHYDFQLGEKSYASKTIGFAFAMKTMGWSAALEWLRLSLLVLILMISWLCVVDRFSLLLSLGATGILFALLAPVSWYYIYVPPLLFLSFAALSEIKPPFSPEGGKDTC